MAPPKSHDVLYTTATVQGFRVSSPVKYIDILQHMLPTLSANAGGSVSFIIRQKVSGWWMGVVVVLVQILMLSFFFIFTQM